MYDAESYNVYQDDAAIATALSTTSFTVEGLAVNETYCFNVTAVNKAGESEKSEEVCVTIESEDGVNELSTAFEIYPNPANDMLFIESDVNVEEVSVYNANGQQATDIIYRNCNQC